MRFLNPKTDFAFKKIFGSESSREILVSFLNAVLQLSGEDVICEVTIIDPYLAPKIEGMKDTFLDVRVRDQRDRSYIVEMQVLNVEGFEKRVLFNACKAYVNQLGRGEPYHTLSEVVAVTITDFEMFPDLARVVSRFRLRADENAAICHQDLELVFAELPKFRKTEAELETTLDLWLYFLKTAKDLTAIPRSLSVEPAIVKALELANRAAWTEEELDDLEKREMWIAEQRHILRKAIEAERKARDAEEKARDAEEKARGAEEKARGAEEKGRADGKAEGKAEMLLHLLPMRCGPVSPEIEERVRKASSEQLEKWSVRLMSARTFEDVFDEPTTH
ncbi:MAG: Rpn family recombination-promoting nuclease/putative transposase [Alphaproteobacteria bacterium]